MIGSIKTLLKSEKKLGKNINLYLLMTWMVNMGVGVIEADFNLYILSMNISPESLGIILGLTPFVQAFSAIPLGYFVEKAGNRFSFLFVNLIVGFAYLLRVISGSQALIMVGALLVGAVQAGYFVTQMPFINQYANDQKDRAYSLASVSHYVARAIGNLIGGFLPTVIGYAFASETLTYRVIMASASILILLAVVPLYFLKKDKPADTSKISLSPYLHGMDKNTVKFAGIEFFLGTGFGFLLFFINVIFVYYYGSTLEAYGTMSLLMIIPIVFFVFAGPLLAKKLGSLRVIATTRALVVVFAVLTIATRNAYIGGAAYIAYRAMIGLGTSLWLSFASSISTDRSRVATSAWLEITFQFGFALAAWGGGQFIARDAYPMLGIVAAASFGIAFVLTLLFFGKKYLPKPASPQTS